MVVMPGVKQVQSMLGGEGRGGEGRGGEGRGRSVTVKETLRERGGRGKREQE